MADPRSSRRPARVIGLAAAAALACSACAGQAAPTGTGTTPGTEHSATGAGPATASVATRLEVTVPALAVTQLALGETHLAYAVVTSDGGQNARPNGVEVLDLESREVRRIASSSWPAGQTDLVRTDGDWILWEDLERTPTTGGGAMRWKVMAHRLSDSSTHTLADHGRPGVIPTLAAGSGRLVWAGNGDGSEGLSLHAYETATGTSRELATGLPRVTDLAAAPDGAYYTVADLGTAAQVTWRVPWSGGSPARVDTGGSSRGFRVADSGLASWEDAAAGPAKRLGIARLGGVESAGRFAAGPNYLDVPDASNTAPGEDVVSYFDGQAHFRAVPVRGDGSLGTPVAVSADGEMLHVPCRIAAHGHDVAYCTEPDPAAGGPPTVTVRVKTIALGQ